MSTIKENILSSFNSEKIGTKKTIYNILNEKGIIPYDKNFSDLYDLYEKEAEHLVRNSSLIKNNGDLYVFSREGEDKYYLEKAEIMDRIMNFFSNG